MKPFRRLVQFAAGFLLLAAGVSAAAEELSHVRIVRLSFAEGVVTVLRPDAGEWATAPVNTPIQEGFKIATNEAGFAEIEFENVSTARIGQGTLLEFTQLALLPSGAKVNRMSLEQGYATFNLMPEDGDSYEVTAGSATMTPHDKARFRVDFENGVLQVRVFTGSVEIMSPEGTGTLGKNTLLEIRPDAEQPFEISQGFKKDAWDEWVEDREKRIEQVRNSGGPRTVGLYSNNTSDLLWGTMDLWNYGSWITHPIYGYGWVPTVGAGWSPYTNGRWCHYPGMGYTWIGSEPWGWLPYHYGSWMHEGGIGWYWIPTGGFGAWSPARVDWYQGHGWVGWSPRGPVAGGFGSSCPRSEGCVAITNDGSISGGRSIQPGDLRWGRHLDVGRTVDTVSVEPRREALMPGAAREPSIGFGRGFGGLETGQPSGGTTIGEGISITGGTAGASATPGVVYDPETRQYVNNPAAAGAAPAPAIAPSPVRSSGGFSRGGSFGGSVRPGPTTTYPAPVAEAQRGSAERRGSNSTGSNDRDWIRSNAVGWGIPGQSGGSSGGSQSTSSGASASGSSTSNAGSSSASSGRSSGSNSGGGRSSGGFGGGSSAGSGGGRSSGGFGGGGSAGSGGGGRSSGGGFGGGGAGGGGGRSTGGGGGSTRR